MMSIKLPTLLARKFAACLIVLASTPSFSQARQVTSYIVEVQEERQSTRWTLTEWLRIKERIKMMDVWLAMFSQPEEKRFAPELVLEYSPIQGQLYLQPYEQEEDRIELEEPLGFQARGQFWLTNLVSSTTGVKTLNIDLGLEAGTYRLVQPRKEDYSSEITDAAPWDGLKYQAYSKNWWAANFRIFGANIQDSSLILKYGAYKSRPFAYTDSEARSFTGKLAGAEAYLYLLSWLGAEADYLRFGNAKGAAGSPERSATMLIYGGFIEIYMLRIGYRLQEYSGSWRSSPQIYEFNHQGPAWYVRLNF